MVVRDDRQGGVFHVERPTRIVFGGREILVVSDVDTSLDLADEGLDGESDLKVGVIRIRHDLGEAEWHETLLHELLHFVWHATALPHLLEEHEELVVRSISPWLFNLVRVRSGR